MKKQFLRDLNRELRPLKKEERKKCLIFNNAYVIFDVIVLVVSYLLAYYICFISGIFEMFHLGLPFYYYFFSLILIIPSYVILYVRFKLYTVNCVCKKGHEAWNIFCANFIGLMLFALVLYLFKQYYFSRMMLVIFFCINVIMGIVVRNLIFNCFYSFQNKLDSSGDCVI